jgi:hypothetical protein
MAALLIRNISVHGWYCNSMVTSLSWYWRDRLDEYNGDYANFGYSALQNLLGNVVSLTNTYLSLKSNSENWNVTGIHYDAARIVRMLTIFAPIEPIEEDLNRIMTPGDDSALYTVHALG